MSQKAFSVLLFIIFGAIFAQAGGFADGNSYTATEYSGRLTVHCRGDGFRSATYFCEEEFLSPAERSYFVPDSEVDADRVELVATWENGKSRDKDKRFKTSKQRSSGRFNLWLASLTQRPLLDYGVNKVDYILTKDDELVREGSFTVQVDRAEPKVCDPRTITSFQPNDCRYGGSSSLCYRYFRQTVCR